MSLRTLPSLTLPTPVADVVIDSPLAAKLANSIIGVILARARRGEASEDQLRTAQGLVELLGRWLELDASEQR